MDNRYQEGDVDLQYLFAFRYEGAVVSSSDNTEDNSRNFQRVLIYDSGYDPDSYYSRFA